MFFEYFFFCSWCRASTCWAVAARFFVCLSAAVSVLSLGCLCVVPAVSLDCPRNVPVLYARAKWPTRPHRMQGRSPESAIRHGHRNKCPCHAWQIAVTCRAVLCGQGQRCVGVVGTCIGQGGSNSGKEYELCRLLQLFIQYVLSLVAFPWCPHLGLLCRGYAGACACPRAVAASAEPLRRAGTRNPQGSQSSAAAHVATVCYLVEGSAPPIHSAVL